MVLDHSSFVPAADAELLGRTEMGDFQLLKYQNVTLLHYNGLVLLLFPVL